MDLRALALAALAAVVFKNPQAQEHYRKALEYGDKGLWPPAILELNQARELEPANAEILIELGIAHGERQEFKEALMVLRRAVAVAPSSALAHYNLALTLDKADPGKGAGIPEYRKALGLDPRNVDALMNLAVDIGERNATEAKPLFERAIKLAPGNARLHLNYAFLLKRQAEQSASLAEFQEAVRRDPELLEARRQVATLLMAQQEFSGAIEQCREILKREPDDAATHYTLGQALMRSNQEQEGKEELAQVRAIRKRKQDQQDAQELQNQGIRCLRAGQLQDASKAFESAVKLDPTSDNHMYLGMALGPAGIGELTTAVTVDPRNARAHLNLGTFYLQNGREGEAKEEIDKALQIDPWMAEAHNNLGMILAGSQQFEEAVKHFQLAAGLQPRYVEALFNLGLALRNLNRTDDALKAFRQAAELAPDNPQAQYALKMTLRDKAAGK